MPHAVGYGQKKKKKKTRQCIKKGRVLRRGLKQMFGKKWEHVVDTGIKESTLWTIRVPQIMKVRGWTTLKCCEVNEKAWRNERENDSTSGLKTKSWRNPKQPFSCVPLYVHNNDLKWEITVSCLLLVSVVVALVFLSDVTNSEAISCHTKWWVQMRKLQKNFTAVVQQ